MEGINTGAEYTESDRKLEELKQGLFDNKGLTESNLGHGCGNNWAFE